MIHFVDHNNISTTFKEQGINKLIIPLSVDTLADCQIFRTISGKYPDLDAKFAAYIIGKNFKPSDYIKIQVDSGHIIFFILVRAVEKFQPYLIDTTRAIEKVFEVIRREAPAEASMRGSVFFPMPDETEFKLCDAIFIPAIASCLNCPDINVYILSNGEHENYIESVTEDIVHVKRDSWKSDWMLTFDDVLFVAVLNKLLLANHDFKLSKANLVRCYYICHQNGMFPKFEFYDTEFGKFFKMFFPKSNSLINHGLLMNVHHYSNQEPKKFSCVIGPMMPMFNIIAYSQLNKYNEKIGKIVADIKIDYIKSFQQKADKSGFIPKTTPQSNAFNF